MRHDKKSLIFRILLFLFVLVLSIILFLNREAVQKIAHFGYGGIFLINIITNATLILPLPGVVFTSAMGAVFNPFLVAMAAGLGAGLGEITGYLAGYSGQIIMDRSTRYETLSGWMKKYGNLTILVMAIIPNPFFDLAGIAAGILKLPLSRFLFWCSLGKIIKMLFFAYTGGTVLNLIFN